MLPKEEADVQAKILYGKIHGAGLSVAEVPAEGVSDVSGAVETAEANVPSWLFSAIDESDESGSEDSAEKLGGNSAQTAWRTPSSCSCATIL